MDDWVKIETKAGNFIARAKLDKNLAYGAIFAQHGWTVSTHMTTPTGLVIH